MGIFLQVRWWKIGPMRHPASSMFFPMGK
jgi:hypothetical protein